MFRKIIKETIKRKFKVSTSTRRILKVSTLAGAIGLGYVIGKADQSETSGNLQKNIPFIESINAASSKGSELQIQNVDLVPMPPSNSTKVSQIMRFGFPSFQNVRSMNDFVFSYDTRNKVPNWVFEYLTEESVSKSSSVDRTKSDFHEDHSVHEFFRSKNKDYKASGLDRGHMAAAGNHRKSQKDCDETFLLSNMAPQVGRGFNRGKWNELESHCRKLARQFTNVYVCTGPLYLPINEDDGKLYIKYQVIGDNHVAVPTHFFKVVLCETSQGELEMESYLMPNQVIEDKIPISNFMVPPDVIERASGLLLFDRLNKSKMSKLNGKSLKWF